jgi:phosphatidylglycerophosphatase A
VGEAIPVQTPGPAIATGSAESEEAPRQQGGRFFLLAATGSWFFTGYAPIAPATVTSLTVLPAVWLFRSVPWPWHALAIAVTYIAGVPLATALERYWGRDPGRVTIDEVTGTLVTFFLNPVSLWGLALGFVCWRAFDIVKLPFIDRSQRLPGGWGVMTDDLLAGVCANVVLRLGLLLVPALRMS